MEITPDMSYKQRLTALRLEKIKIKLQKCVKPTNNKEFNEEVIKTLIKSLRTRRLGKLVGYLYKCKKCGLVHVILGKYIYKHRCPDCNGKTVNITAIGFRRFAGHTGGAHRR